MKEDVTEIVLNVKSIIAKLYSEGVKTVYIEANGECEVTAGDIKSDGEVEIRIRATGETIVVPVEEAVARLRDQHSAALKGE